MQPGEVVFAGGRRMRVGRNWDGLKMCLCLAFLTAIVVFFIIPCGWLGLEVAPDFDGLHIEGSPVEVFEIEGNSGKQLWNEIEAKKTFEGEGQAITLSTIYYSFDTLTQPDGSCEILNIQTRYTVVVKAAHWNNPESAPITLVWAWEAYMRGVGRHEENHVQIVLDNFPRVKTAIEESTCDNAKTNADAAIAEIQSRHDEYDDATDHGNKEGIFFPSGGWPWE